MWQSKDCRWEDVTFERAEVIRWGMRWLSQSLEEVKQRAKHSMASLFQMGCFDCENKVQIDGENKIGCTRFLNLLSDTWVFENPTLLAVLAYALKKHWYGDALSHRSVRVKDQRGNQNTEKARAMWNFSLIPFKFVCEDWQPEMITVLISKMQEKCTQTIEISCATLCWYVILRILF